MRSGDVIDNADSCAGYLGTGCLRVTQWWLSDLRCLSAERATTRYGIQLRTRLVAVLTIMGSDVRRLDGE